MYCTVADISAYYSHPQTCHPSWLSGNAANERSVNPQQEAWMHSDSLVLYSKDSRKVRPSNTFVGDQSMWQCPQLYISVSSAFPSFNWFFHFLSFSTIQLSTERVVTGYENATIII